MAGSSFLLIPQPLHIMFGRVVAGGVLAGFGLTAPYMYSRLHPPVGIVLALVGFVLMTVGQADDVLRWPSALFLAIMGAICMGSVVGMWDFSRRRERPEKLRDSIVRDRGDQDRHRRTCARHVALVATTGAGDIARLPTPSRPRP